MYLKDQAAAEPQHFFKFILFYLFFIFGCVGSSLLCVGFL